MSENLPSLPVYQKPKERKPATIPPAVAAPPPPKPPGSLNKLMGKMLKPQMLKSMKAMHSPKSLKNKHKVHFY